MRNTFGVSCWALVAGFLLCSAWSSVASAASPAASCWATCFYKEPGGAFFYKHNVCFTPNGTWSSNTQNGGWAGGWFQKGEQVRWYGNTQALATAAFGQFTSPDEMTGEYAEWHVPGASDNKHYSYVMFRNSAASCPPGTR